VPDSYGKRQRNAQKARKFAAREERRAARKQQRADREAGVTDDQTPVDPDQVDAADVPDQLGDEGDSTRAEPESPPEPDQGA
jgi:hypothetical protein